MSNSAKTILVAEDDANDVFFLQYAFETVGISNPVQVVPDGQQAMDYLSGTGRFSDRTLFPMPALMLLDLKLPVRMGLDVLRWIQSQPQLASVLVVVMTSSSDARDVERAYALGAKSYLVKPVSLQKRVEMIQVVKEYWLDMNRFPSS